VRINAQVPMVEVFFGYSFSPSVRTANLCSIIADKDIDVRRQISYPLWKPVLCIGGAFCPEVAREIANSSSYGTLSASAS
jgi:hypothetical protein